MEDRSNGLNGTCYFPSTAGVGRRAWLARSGGPKDVEVLCKSSALRDRCIWEPVRLSWSWEALGYSSRARTCATQLPPAASSADCDMVPGYLFFPRDYIDVSKFPGIRVMAGAEPLRMSRQ